MKKIVFISGRLGGGGSERVLTLVANELKRRGYGVSIITFTLYNNSYDNSCDVKTITFSNDIEQIIKLRKAIIQTGADTVIAFEYYVGMKTVLATRGLDKKVIVSERNDPHKLDDRRFKKWLRNVLYKKADLLVCQTIDAQKYFNRLGINNTTVLCNPVKEGLPYWNPKNDREIIVNFCKLEKQKNIPLLINAFEIVHRELPSALLYIYGEGTEEAYLRKMIAEKGMADFIKIFPFNNNIHKTIAEYNLFVSSSDYEGLSNSMLEAMAIGMPVVCTDCPIGGASMIIENKVNGFLVPVGDEKILADSIIYCIKKPKIMYEVSKLAGNIRERYSLSEVTSSWEKVI